MTHTRRAALAGALLLVAWATLCAQHAPPRWGGGGVGASSGAIRETHSRVTFIEPRVIVFGTPMTNLATVPSHSSGGSWNGSRPTYGGSPPPQPRPRGVDLSGFFGYVPPRGQTAQNAPVQRAPVVRVRPQPEEHRSQIIWPDRRRKP